MVEYKRRLKNTIKIFEYFCYEISIRGFRQTVLLPRFVQIYLHVWQKLDVFDSHWVLIPTDICKKYKVLT